MLAALIHVKIMEKAETEKKNVLLYVVGGKLEDVLT
jgi:hypothetical protein